MDAQHEPIGFNGRQSAPVVMARAHMHTEFELNYAWRGVMTYFLAGEFVTVPAQRLVVFWAGMPHRVTAVAPGTKFIWLTMPLAWVLQWELPAVFTHRLFAGELLREPDAHRSDLDRALMTQWAADVRTPQRKIALLEIEARLRRLAATSKSAVPVGRAAPGGPVEQATRFIGEHYAEPLTVPQIAAAVGRHPNYLMQLFRRSCGTSLWDYVLRLRVSHAQRLLLTTDRKIVDVAFAAGFASVSRFYEAFQKYCRQTPRQYRVVKNRNGAPARIRPGAKPVG
jgi:AraC-like DNA-binding protein